MGCALSDEQLWSWIDRAAPELEEHLDGCPECRRRAGDIRADMRAVADHATPPRRWQPERIGPYRIRRRLGEGGQGLVFEAEQPGLNRQVALKVVRGGRFVDDYDVKLFHREVQTLARLRHPCIASIYEAGQTEDGHHYFTMELVRGAPLNEFVRAARTPWRQRLELFRRICEAVHHAHQRGVIHRDLKPSNILIDADGNPKILDFGLARLVGREGRPGSVSSAAGRVLGTPAYMSPEHVRGDSQEIDVRSDVYSLGVIAFELMTDRQPFDFDTQRPLDAIRRILDEPPVRPSNYNRRLRGDVDTIILKSLEKDPDRRYQSASALAEDVGRFLRGEPIEARRASKWYVLRKQLARHKTAVSAAALVVLVSLVGAVVAAAGWKKAAENADKQRAAVGQLEFALTVMPVDQLTLLAARYREAGDAERADYCERLARLVRREQWNMSLPNTSIQVSLYRGEDAVRAGIMGFEVMAARPRDRVRIHARTRDPSYMYLLALNTDGTVSLCYPADRFTAADKLDDLVYPSNGALHHVLPEKPGLQAFVLLIAQRGLPAFAEWERLTAPLPWAPSNADGVWRSDGQRYDRIGGWVAGPEQRTPPEPFAAACRQLYLTRGIDAVQAIAFPIVAPEVPILDTVEP